MYRDISAGHICVTGAGSGLSPCYNNAIDIDSLSAPRSVVHRLPPRARRWLHALAPLLLFTVLTIVAAWPLLTRLDGVIVGDDQDVFINPWADMWTLMALQDPERSLWFTDYLFYPHGASLHYHSFSHLTSAVSLALRPLFGNLAAYNLAVLLHLLLAGLAMYHLARYLTGSALAGLLAGIVFAFNSHNVWQTSHPVLVSIWPLPWSALFLLQALERRDRRRALVAAAFVLLAALCSTLMLILTALWLAFILFFAFVSRRLNRSALPTLGLFAAASLALATVPLLPLLAESLLQANASFVVNVTVHFPTDVVAPLRPYWLGLLPRSLHFGVVPLLLLFAALFRLRQSWPWFLFLAVVYLFAIGPQPIVAGVQTDLRLPWSELVLPVLRHTHRLNVLLSAALAVLVAYGWSALDVRLGAARWRRWLLAALFGALIFAEYTHPSFPYRQPLVSSFYTEYLKTVPDDVALAILPTGRQEDKLYMYYQTLHGHKITGGVISRPGQDVFRFIRSNPLLRAGAVNWEPVPLPTDATAALEELAHAGVGLLVLENRLFRQNGVDLAPWRAAIPATPVYEDDLVVVYPTTAPTGAGIER